MLKIKDNVDLDILSGYGFGYNSIFNLYEKEIYSGRRGQNFILIINKFGEIKGYANGADGDGEDDFIDDTLYDLIKDELVEKV